MESSMSTLTTRGSMSGELAAGVAKKRGVGVEGGTHQLALTLPAAVDVHLKGLQDLVVLRRGYRLRHASENTVLVLRTSTDKCGQRGRREATAKSGLQQWPNALEQFGRCERLS